MKCKSLLLFIILSSCQTHQTKAIPTPKPVDQCSVFMDFIQNNWIRIDRNIYGIKSDSLVRKETIRIFREMSNKCLTGKSKKDIYQIFGVPSRVQEGSPKNYLIQYYLKSECNYPVNGCIQLKILMRPSVDTVIKVLPMITEFVEY